MPSAIHPREYRYSTRLSLSPPVCTRFDTGPISSRARSSLSHASAFPGKGVAVENITFVFSRRASAVKGCGWTQTLMSFFFHCQIVLDRRNSRNTLSNFPCEIYLRLIWNHSYKRNLAATSDGVKITRLQALLLIQRRLNLLRQLPICCSNRRTRGSCC